MSTDPATQATDEPAALVKVDSTKKTLAGLNWDADYTDLIKRTVLKPKKRAATNAELFMFAEQVERTRLDPFLRQIYGIYRFDSQVGDEVMQPQVGIDGFRLVAERTGKYEGQTEQEWCGKDGIWKTVWTSDEKPFAARCGVWKTGRRTPTYAVAHWSEYVQGTSPMWKKMPANQISKCFDEETEILTTHGFQRFADVTGVVLQVTALGLEPSQARPFSQAWDGPMIVLGSDHLDFAVTPNHDMIVIDRHAGETRRMEAGDLYEQAVSAPVLGIPRVVHGSRVEAPISDALLVLAAAYVADGYDATSGMFKVAVSKERKVDQLTTLGLHRSRVERLPESATGRSGRVVTARATRSVFTYDHALVSGLVAPGKIVSVGALLELSRRQARVFADALIGFDGHTQKKSGVRRLYTSRLDHLAAYEVACIAAGYAVSRRRSRTSDLSLRPNYYVTVTDRDVIPCRRWGKVHSRSNGNASGRTGLEVRPNTSGRVWCVTVPSGEIIVRRKGFSMRCGNCAEALALRKAFPNELSGLYTPEEMAQADRDNLGDGKGTGEAAGLALGPAIEAIIARAERLGHHGLADRGTIEMDVCDADGRLILAKANRFVAKATAELDAMPPDAAVVTEPAAPETHHEPPPAPDPERIAAMRRRGSELLAEAEALRAAGDERADEACSACGAPSKGRVALAMQERRTGLPGANPTAYPAIDSTSRTYCEPCAIRVYEACKAAMVAASAQPEATS